MNIIMAVVGLVGLKRAPECIKMKSKPSLLKNSIYFCFTDTIYQIHGLVFSGANAYIVRTEILRGSWPLTTCST